jgi:hypothetical protein
VGGAYTAGFGAEVVWDDNSVINTTTSPPTVTGSGNGAIVKVKTNSGVSGNAVVKIYKASDTSTKTPVWSYHIWVTGYDPDDENATEHATFTNTYNTNNNGGHFVFMDRNLGATASGQTSNALGLCYQWGRKDPFRLITQTNTTNANSTTGQIIYTIQNPSRFLLGSNQNVNWYYGSETMDEFWGNSGRKTIYDPCPTGWRVPTNKNKSAGGDAFAGLTDANKKGGVLTTWANGSGELIIAWNRGIGWTGSPINNDGYHWHLGTAHAEGTQQYTWGYDASHTELNNSWGRLIAIPVRCVRE